MVWFGDFKNISDKKLIKQLLQDELNAKGIRFKKNTVKFKLKDSDLLTSNESDLMKSFRKAGIVFKGFY